LKTEKLRDWARGAWARAWPPRLHPAPRAAAQLANRAILLRRARESGKADTLANLIACLEAADAAMAAAARGSPPLPSIPEEEEYSCEGGSAMAE
jgi:hypothetical protein